MNTQAKGKNRPKSPYRRSVIPAKPGFISRPIGTAKTLDEALVSLCGIPPELHNPAIATQLALGAVAVRLTSPRLGLGYVLKPVRRTWKVTAEFPRDTPACRIDFECLAKPGPEHRETLRLALMEFIQSLRGYQKPPEEFRYIAWSFWTGVRYTVSVIGADAAICEPPAQAVREALEQAGVSVSVQVKDVWAGAL